MGEKTHIHRFRPDSSSPLYGRKDPFPLISPRLCLPAIRPSSYFYGRKDPHPSISPRLFSITLWAKRPASPDFAQTLHHLFMGEKPHFPRFRPDSAFPPFGQAPTFMGEKTRIPRFRPDSSSPLYGRNRTYPSISPRLCVPANPDADAVVHRPGLLFNFLVFTAIITYGYFCSRVCSR